MAKKNKQHKKNNKLKDVSSIEKLIEDKFVACQLPELKKDVKTYKIKDFFKGSNK